MASNWMSLLAAATFGAALGYFASSTVSSSGGEKAHLIKSPQKLPARSAPASEEGEDDDDDDVEALKMILVVRQDLKMGKGKIAAQCCHAAVGVVQDMYETEEGCSALERWVRVTTRAPVLLRQAPWMLPYPLSLAALTSSESYAVCCDLHLVLSKLHWHHVDRLALTLPDNCGSRAAPS